MLDTDKRTPFGRGFVAAGIVIAAVLLCGAFLLLAGPQSEEAAPAVRRSSELSGSPAMTEAVTPFGTPPATPSATPSATRPATPSAGPARPVVVASSGAAGGCALPDGAQEVPLRGPAVDGWEVSRRVVVPRSTALGPARVDADGFRRCFAHSPSGAVFAACNAVAALADQAQATATVRKLMLPGPDTDALLRELRAEAATGSSSEADPTQLAGFRVIDASRDRVSIALAVRVEPRYAGLTVTLVWYGGDWRVLPPPAGQAFGAPYSQHPDLEGYVAWSGV